MRDFGVFDEVDIDKVPREALESAISTKWVKLRKPDGTVRCRIVARGYTQQVEDKDDRDFRLYTFPHHTSVVADFGRCQGMAHFDRRHIHSFPSCSSE